MTRTATFVALLLVSTSALAWNRLEATRFATLPSDTAHPEGITADAAGNIYVADFDVDHPGTSGVVVIFDHSGHVLREVRVAGSTNLLLGLDFTRCPATRGEMLVIDFGGQKVLSVNLSTGASTLFTDLGGGGPNALTFDALGNVYISDSGRGIIWKTLPCGGTAQAWVPTNPLLLPNGYPPFGANGIGFNKARTIMYVANTGNDTLVKIPVSSASGGTLTAGTASIFTNSINGADGIVLDANDNIWVAANQADEIVIVDPTGKAIAKLGDFNGVHNGVTSGMLFPASPAFSKDGTSLFVTNLELDLTSIGLTQSVDSQWAAQVKRHSIAKLPARIPSGP